MLPLLTSCKLKTKVGLDIGSSSSNLVLFGNMEMFLVLHVSFSTVSFDRVLWHSVSGFNRSAKGVANCSIILKNNTFTAFYSDSNARY